MFFTPDQIIAWLLVYKYIILFPFMVIEGPIITIIAGFLSSIDLLNIFIVYPVVVAADLIGDFIYYAIGRWGRESFLGHYGKYIGLSIDKIEKLEDHFQKHAKKTLIVGKLSHAIGAPILVAAGIVRFPLWEFFWINLLTTLLKSGVFLAIGYYFGQAYVRLNKYLDYFTIGIIILAIVFILSYYSYNRIRQRLRRISKEIEKRNILKN